MNLFQISFCEALGSLVLVFEFWRRSFQKKRKNKCSTQKFAYIWLQYCFDF